MTHTRQLITLAIACSPLFAQSVPYANQQPRPMPFDAEQSWTHFGGDPKHQSRTHTTGSLAPLTTPSWVAGGDGSITYIPRAQSGIVADQDQIYALATDPSLLGSALIVCYDRMAGSFNWATPVAPAILDSWSTPTVDVQHQQLIVGSGSFLTAIDTITGIVRWTTDIGGVVVNASPIVADDLGDNDRAFITNYSFGGGTPSKLTCINIDPFNASNNPYQPGEIVWQTSLLGDSSGNTPAYANGMVYVSTASSPGSQAGQVHAFDATATTAPSPSWTFTNTINAGFFSGVSIARGHVYASSYSFTGLQYSANTVKLNKHTGDLVWSIPTNRTDATPIVLPGGDVVVSGGIATGAFDFLPFYGSLPSIQYIADNNTPILLWDSALATLDDTNANGYWDFGESYLSIGGWTHQPIAITIDNAPMLLVGTLAQTTPGVQFNHNTNLSLIDLSKPPTDPNFVVEQYTGAGSTPAIVGSWIYSSGQAGIHAFAQPAPTPSHLIEQYINRRLTIDELLSQLRK